MREGLDVPNFDSAVRAWLNENLQLFAADKAFQAREALLRRGSYWFHEGQQQAVEIARQLGERCADAKGGGAVGQMPF